MKQQARRRASSTSRRTLTYKQRLYLKNRRQGMSKWDAAKEAGYSDAVARSVAQKIESSPPVRRALDRWLDREGLSDRALASQEAFQ